MGNIYFWNLVGNLSVSYVCISDFGKNAYEIYDFEQFKNFIMDVVNHNDKYKEKRIKVRDYIYKYHDGHSSERLAKLLNL